MKLTKREIFTIPNILSYIRLLLIPVFVYIYITADHAEAYYIAAFIILVSGLTDMLDGWIARKFNQITELGKTVDPIADKLTQAAILGCLMFRYDYMWILVILLVVKELFMGINGLILLKRGKKLDGAMWFGKVSTAVFYVATFILIGFPEISSQVASLLILSTGAFLALAFVLYIPEFLKLYRKV
ncbi:CDP-alcohol phosphatidyltransferase family protein [Ornithinibacillus halotolerans]|uniref:CDP-diacylglycerol--glycerol-3-phosphate 3-phosphatidyltransferase n=1 Tax=Ornithinibacillus halotolerans TaxID=1274357 RepID=A0A916S664_9BACI|nr:CDP-alcohol phosphatidyltransferase family protein [Ornithinibacillus halotolerans]GGA83460.1 CDP-alcohol phosphatidyltransferase [Ornithinibacillus halotolerans]